MTESLVTVRDLKKATRGNKDQIYGDLSRLKKHLNSVDTGRKHEKTCVVCGNIAYPVVSCVEIKPCTFPLERQVLQKGLLRGLP